MAIRRPVESDFEVVCHEFDVQVTFKPANSHYGCDVLTDGRLSPSGPTVRHDGIRQHRRVSLVRGPFDGKTLGRTGLAFPQVNRSLRLLPESPVKLPHEISDAPWKGLGRLTLPGEFASYGSLNFPDRFMSACCVQGSRIASTGSHGHSSPSSS
jgi:hypothetical protein